VADLALILTQFASAAVSDLAGSGRTLALPRLPALETLLARAQVESLPHGWRAWVARRLGWPEDSVSAALAAAAFRERLSPHPALALSVGAPPAAALAATPQVHYWFATPLHLFAGLDSVHLHPAGLLELSGSEQQLLAADFARVFAGAQWVLSTIGQRELLLTGPPLYASGSEPEELLTRSADACMPRGADAPALRRLASEIELWLHEHPLNHERSSRGALPVTALWLWGGSGSQSAATVAAAPSQPPPRVYGADSYVAALGRLRGEAVLPLPARLDAESVLLAPARGPRDARNAIVLLSLTPAMVEGGIAAALSDFEQHWLGAALQAVRTRRIGALHCLLGARAYRLTWRQCIRVWRARAPWWEGLS
jgi:hypothetical protein